MSKKKNNAIRPPNLPEGFLKLEEVKVV